MSGAEAAIVWTPLAFDNQCINLCPVSLKHTELADMLLTNHMGSPPG